MWRGKGFDNSTRRGDPETMSVEPELTTTSPKIRLSNMLYDELRKRIITGVYPQGHRIIEYDIATEFKVSRIPLREAMPRLAVDGFVRVLPRRGAQVTVWSPALVNELFEARLALEVRAARLAARRAQDDTSLIPALTESVEATWQSVKEPQSLHHAVTHAALHQRLVEASGNTLLSALMEAVSGRLTWIYFLTNQNDQIGACAEHDAILDAIQEGNELLAESRMAAHVESGRAPCMARIAAPGDY